MADAKTPTAKDAKSNDKKAVVKKSANQTIKERGSKGVLAIMAKVAFSVAAKQEISFEGTDAEGTESHHSALYQISKEGGKIDQLDEKGKQFTDLVAKAKACKDDLSSDEPAYTKNVKAFIVDLLKLKAPSESLSVVLRGVSF